MAKGETYITQKPHVEHMCILAALGLPRDEIAKRTGFNHRAVLNLLQRPENKAKIDAYLYKHTEALMDREIRSMGLKALGVIDGAMDPSEDTSDRLNAAKYTVDRLKGKATQPMEHTGSSFGTILAKLESIPLTTLFAGANKDEAPTPVTDIPFTERTPDPID